MKFVFMFFAYPIAPEYSNTFKRIGLTNRAIYIYGIYHNDHLGGEHDPG